MIDRLSSSEIASDECHRMSLMTSNSSSGYGLVSLGAHFTYHYNDVIMSAMGSQITSLAIVYSAVYSDADQRKHQSSALLAICAGNSPVTGEFPAQMASNAENISIWWRYHGGFTLIPAWISNYIHGTVEVWKGTAEVWKGISNFIPGHVITQSCWD